MLNSKPKSSEIITGKINHKPCDQFDSRCYLHHHHRWQKRGRRTSGLKILELTIEIQTFMCQLTVQPILQIAHEEPLLHGPSVQFITHTYERPQMEQVWRVFRSFLKVHPACQCVGICARHFHRPVHRRRRTNHGKNNGGLDWLVLVLYV